MPDLGPLLFWPAFVYLAAVAAVCAALILRTFRRNALPSPADTLWNAALAPVAAIALPICAVAAPHAGIANRTLHRLWHHWEAAAHQSPLFHGCLHLVNLGLVAAAAVVLARTVATLARERAFAVTMASLGRCTSEFSGVAVYRLLAAQPVCFTLGAFQPRIYLSENLEAQLEAEEIRAVLAHEQAHVGRRDGLVAGALTLFYTLIPVPGSGVLLRDWRTAAERACDTAAAREVGSPTLVARALLKAAKLTARSGSALPGATAFTGEEDVEGRVRALLAKTTTPSNATGWRWMAAVALLAAAPFLHHLAELLVHH